MSYFSLYLVTPALYSKLFQDMSKMSKSSSQLDMLYSKLQTIKIAILENLVLSPDHHYIGKVPISFCRKYLPKVYVLCFFESYGNESV